VVSRHFEAISIPPPLKPCRSSPSKLDYQQRDENIKHRASGTWKGQLRYYPNLMSGFYATRSLLDLNESAYATLEMLKNPPPSLCAGTIPRMLHFFALSQPQERLTALTLKNLPTWRRANPRWQIFVHHRWSGDVVPFLQATKLRSYLEMARGALKTAGKELVKIVVPQEVGGLYADISVFFPSSGINLDHLLGCAANATKVRFVYVGQDDNRRIGTLIGGVRHNAVLASIIQKGGEWS
jgi:hypothetical protein